MKHLYLRISTTSPLSIRADHAEEGASTTQTIPGATVLGSLAAAHRILRPQDDAGFRQLFLNEQVSIPPLYPANFKLDEFHKSGLPVIPLPKTAQTCKRFPGFHRLDGEEESDKERHGIRDSLFERAILSLLQVEHRPIPTLVAVLDKHKECRICKTSMDYISGFYRCSRYNPGQHMKAFVETHLQTRTGINRTWGTVEEGILYNREVFDEKMRFWGEVILPDEVHNPLKDFLAEAIKEDVIRMGTGRTRGLGRIEILEPLLPEAKVEDLASFTQRLENFNTEFQKQAKEAGVQQLDPFYFAITLRSATVLHDAFLRSYLTLSGDALARELHMPEEGKLFKSVYQAVDMQRIAGWNELWGTPRPHDYALSMGSTFLFACARPSPALFQQLSTLAETGAGQRRMEGFGRMSISDLFHLQGEPI